jgi:hypothetical protein
LPAIGRRFSAQLVVEIAAHYHLTIVALLCFDDELSQLITKERVHFRRSRKPVLQCYTCNQ